MENNTMREYIEAEMEIIRFDNEDIITGSGTGQNTGAGDATSGDDGEINDDF